MNSDEVSLAFEKRQGRRPFRVSPDAVSTFVAFGVFGIGALVLIGWACDIAVLKSLQPGLISMKANTAVAFMLTGLALWFLQAKRVHARAGRHAAWVCASVVALLGLLTLAENVCRWDLGIDRLLFAEPAGTAQTVHPGRMAPTTALNFLLIGVSLLLLDVRTRRGHRPAQFLIVCVGIISGAALLGYVYGVSVLFSPSAAVNPMSVPAAVAGLLAFASLLLARPGPWLLGILADEKPGSLMARRFFLPILLLPTMLDVVLLSGQHAGLYDEHIAAAAHTTLMTAIFMGLVLAAAASLNRIEDKLRASGPGQAGGLSPRSAMPEARPPAGLWSVWTVILVAAATLLRLGFLQMLGTRATYITFYPAVTLAALYGGLPAGLLATVLSAMVADYLWLQPVHTFAIKDPADWLSIAIFIGSGTLISIVAEGMHRARARANAAEVRARFATEPERAEQKVQEGERRVAVKSAGVFPVNAAFAVGLALLALTAWMTIRNMNTAAEGERSEVHTHLVNQGLARLLTDMLDAETGQRGYLVTGDEKYLEPYNRALTSIEASLANLVGLTRDNPSQQKRLAEIAPLVQAKLVEMKQTIRLRTAEGPDAARQAVMSHLGRSLMDDIRQRIGGAQAEEARLSQERSKAMEVSDRALFQTLVAGGLMSFGLLAIAFLLLRRQIAGRVHAESLARRAAEREQAAQALREADERLRFALETSHTGAWDLDLVDHTAFRSLEHDRVFGYAELLPKWTYEMFLEHVLPEDRAAVDAKFRHAMETQSDWSFECRIRRADGETRWIWGAGRHRTDTAGKARRMAGIVQDITGRKQAEAALKKTHAELETRVQERTAELKQASVYNRSLLEASLDPLVAIGPDGKITDVNAAAEMATGRGRAALIGTDFSDYFTDPEKARASYRQVFREGFVRDYSLELRHHDGRVTPVLYNASVYRDESGKVVGVFAAARDVAAQKRAEEALRESERRYRTLFETMDEGFCVAEMIYDANGKPVDYRFMEINPAFEKHTGLKDALGRTIREIVPNHEAHWFETYGRVVRTGEAVRFENHAAAMNRYFDVYASRVGGPESRRVAILFNDITERKRSEEIVRRAGAYNRSLIEASLDPLVTIGPDGKITDVNAATEMATGRGRAALIGTDFSDYFTDPEKARAGYRQVFREGFVRDYPLELRHRDGRVTPVLYNASVYRDESGKVIGVFAAARDITEQKRAQEEIRRFTEDLRRSNQDLEHFAYVASHDLQEPLRVVSSFSQLLGRRYQGKLDADADEFIAFIVDAAKRMQTLINDLLAFSRIGTRGNPFAPVECEAILRAARENLDVAIAESRAVITHDPLPALLADPTQLTQLFQNLFSNAIKFRRPETPPRIHVSAVRQDGDWRLSVRDNGIGIDPQYFERIFIIFQRLHGREQYPGTGIGLAVCKKIVERHGGRMWVESEPGTGSTFHFTIPETKEQS